VDAWRNKIKENIGKAGKDVASTLPPHFDTRVGKRRWAERSKRETRDTDP
jgi:hypothetical protein